METQIIVLTDQNRKRFLVGKESDLHKAIDIDNGTITPTMGVHRKFMWEDCIVLVMPNLTN